MSRTIFRLSFLLSFSILPATPRASIAQGDAQSVINTGLKLLPAKQRQGVQDYLDVIGFETSGGANIGIVNFNDSYRKENPCFNELVSRFYFDLKETEIDYTLQKSISLANDLSKISNPLSEDTLTENFKPGWLWEKAMRFSKGNPVLAIQLIGICGHDNTAQTDAKFSNKSEYLQNAIQNSSSGLQEKSEAIIKNAVDYVKKNNLILGISIQDYTTSLKQHYSSDEITCPSMSMFIPKSLGSETDIPDSLKNRIANIQAPTLGASALPSKYYHTIGAAYTSCFMYRRGVPSIVADTLANKAIQTYRSDRLCESLTGSSELQYIPTSDLQKFISEPPEKIKELCYDKIDIIESSMIPTYKEPYPPICSIISLLGPELFFSQDGSLPDKSILLRKLDGALAASDVNYLFQNSTYWEKSNQCQGEQIGPAIRNFTEEFSFSNISKNKRRHTQACKDLPSNRCENALKKIETYLIDFEWSEAQHKAGRDFAKQHCKPEHMTKPIEQVACDAIGESNSSNKGSPAIPHNGVQ